MDAVTGRLNGAVEVLLYQWLIKESAEKEKLMTVCLDAMRNLGVWTTPLIDSVPGTTIRPFTFLHHHLPLIK